MVYQRPLSGNNWIDGILWDGWRWDTNNIGVNYADTAAEFPTVVDNFATLNQAQRDAASLAFRSIMTFTGITFSLFDGPTDINLANASKTDSNNDGTLQFDFSLFDANGPSFNTRTTATSTATDITGADLLIYTGGVLNTAADAQAYLAAATGGSVNEGLFIAGTNSGGQTVLFHAVDASATVSTDVDFIANLGTLTSANGIQLGDFAFV